MPTYVTLIRLTQQGIENIRDAGGRENWLRQAIQGMGGELKSRYYTMGQYDGIAIFEAPDDETITKLALAASSRGNARTETFRAFTGDEFRDIVAGLP